MIKHNTNRLLEILILSILLTELVITQYPINVMIFALSFVLIPIEKDMFVDLLWKVILKLLYSGVLQVIRYESR